VRELTWGWPLAVIELRRWRAQALRIPAEHVRRIALLALDQKRGNTHGAALFSIIPHERNLPLLRLLTTYQVLWDFLDTFTETWSGLVPGDILRLHGALVDAVTPTGPIRDYYRQIVVPGDANYLLSLVETCRECCEALPSFSRVAPTLHREAARISVQAINHATSPKQRPRELRRWVAREYPGAHEAAWFELAAAAGANLAIYALFVLAADSGCTTARIANTYRAYFPWAGALATMLDAFVDQCEDASHGEHCYITYYRSPAHATAEISRLVHRYLSETCSLEHSERHTLVAAAMVAMYLSRDSARTPSFRPETRRIARAGGSLTLRLLPVLRLWRIANRTRAA
jgi:tetraprenyl-beta-curcumene synthase